MTDERVVLVVDDDVFLLRAVRRRLEEHAIVLAASSYTEASQMAAAHAVTHAILDIDLGEERTGFDLADELRATRADLPVLFITGKEFFSGRELSLDARTWMVRKPVSGDRLLKFLTGSPTPDVLSPIAQFAAKRRSVTPAEGTALTLRAIGVPAKSIAKALEKSAATIKSQAERARSKASVDCDPAEEARLGEAVVRSIAEVVGPLFEGRRRKKT